MTIINVGTGYPYSPNDAGIVAAIAAAASGDTIYFNDTTINIEGIIEVNKSLIFKGRGWDATTILLGLHAGGEPTWLDPSADGNSQGVFRVVANNVEFCHFKAYAPEAIKSDDHIYGGGKGDQRNLFYMREVYGCKFHDIKVPKYIYNDVIRFSYSHDCTVNNCEFLGGNHDTISYLHSYNITVDNCLMAFATNTCMRWYYAHGITVTRLTIDGNNGGQSCFEMQAQDGTSLIDRIVVKNVTAPFMTYGQGACAVTNTVICAGCNPNCTGTNVITNASPSTDWTSQGYGYNAALVTPTIRINAKSPAYTNTSVTAGQTVTFSVTTDVDCTANINIQGVNYAMTKVSNYTYTKDFTFASTGTYAVKATVTKSGYNSASADWTMTVNSVSVPTSITNYSPTGALSLEANTSKTFSVTLNQSDAIKWYFDGTQVDSITGSSDTVTITFPAVGTHTVKVTAGTASYTWNVTVTQPVVITTIVNKSPLSPITAESDTYKNFNVTLNQSDTIKWYIGSDLIRTVTGISDTFQVFFATSGTFTVKVVAGAAFYTWSITVTDPIITTSITNTSPSSSVTIENNTSKDFSVTLNQSDTIKWYMNTSLVRTTTGASDSLQIFFPTVGTYNVKVIAGSATYTWTITVNQATIPTTITNFSPTSDFSLETNVSKTLSISLNQPDAIKWYADGALVRSVAAMNDSIQTSFSTAGTHVIKVVIGTLYHIWNITVTNPVIPTSITTVSPTGTVNIEAGISKTFNVILNQSDVIKWYSNGTLIKTITASSDSVLIDFQTAGNYNILVTAGNVSNTWSVIVTEPVIQTSIMSYNPTGSVSTELNTSKTFSLILNQPDVIKWYLNNSLIASKTNTSDSVTVLFPDVGVYSLLVTAGNVSQTWSINVTEPINTEVPVETVITETTPADPVLSGTNNRNTFAVKLNQPDTVNWFLNNELISSKTTSTDSVTLLFDYEGTYTLLVTSGNASYTWNITVSKEYNKDSTLTGRAVAASSLLIASSVLSTIVSKAMSVKK